MDEKLKALEDIYHALWFEVVKHDLEVSGYLEEKIFEYERRYISRDQWMRPAYKHADVNNV